MWFTPTLEAGSGAALVPPRPRANLGSRLILVAGGALAVVLLAVLAQLLFAHEAGAAAQPIGSLVGSAESVLNSTPVPAVVSTVTGTAAPVIQSAAAPVVGNPAVSPAVQLITQPVTTLVNSITRSPAFPILPTLPVAPVAPITSGTGIPPAVGGAGASGSTPDGPGLPTVDTASITRTSAGSTAPGASLPTGIGPALGLTLGGPVSGLSLRPGAGPTSMAIGSSFSTSVGQASGPAGRAPEHVPALPLSPETATSDASSPVHGSNPLDGLPPVDLLLPALLVFGIVVARQRNPLFHFDLRSAPPG
jgi:hypothetical protein